MPSRTIRNYLKFSNGDSSQEVKLTNKLTHSKTSVPQRFTTWSDFTHLLDPNIIVELNS